MSTHDLLLGLLMYGVVPVWLVAGLADYACHRLSRIEWSSGVKESFLHLLQFGLVGVPLLAALLLEVNAAAILVMLVMLLLHQAAAVWDVRYGNGTRRVSPVEQHIHGVLEMNPAFGIAIVAILHWDQFIALFGGGNAAFTLAWKHDSLPAWYLTLVLVGVLLFGVLPYGEEFLRTWRAASTKALQPGAVS
jgi:hypothetical protein